VTYYNNIGELGDKMKCSSHARNEERGV